MNDDLLTIDEVERADRALAEAIAAAAHPLRGERGDYDPLLAQIGDARVVLIGGASHGTHELYCERAELTKRLILERGFAAVAVEADWPDAYRVNRFVNGAGVDVDAVDALSDFRRFPQWLWRNADVLDFVGWLRGHNETRGHRSAAVGFYGLDLYSLHASVHTVLRYLDAADPAAAQRARARYACFEGVGDDAQTYGHAAGLGLTRDCEEQAVRQLVEMQQQRAALVRHGGLVGDDDRFDAVQNARVVANAEAYYRQMFRGRVSTWNLRDLHMADTLGALLDHLARRVVPAKVVVWAHNAHVGDARATDMRRDGELNLGQLARERHGGDVFTIGFTTYTGTVSATSDWGEPLARKAVVPALRGSYEHMFHCSGVPRFALGLRDLGEVAGGLRVMRLERFIGVVYRPETERASHYMAARLPEQFDAVVHVDVTRAVEPLERVAPWDEEAETYPSGL